MVRLCIYFVRRPINDYRVKVADLSPPRNIYNNARDSLISEVDILPA